MIKLNQPRDNSMKKAAQITSETALGTSDKAYDKNTKSMNRPLTSVLEENIVFDENEDDVSGDLGYNNTAGLNENRFSIQKDE